MLLRTRRNEVVELAVDHRLVIREQALFAVRQTKLRLGSIVE